MRRAALLTVAMATLFGASLHRVMRQAAVVHAERAGVSYRRQIAPIFYSRCTSCHHSGGSGPFALMNYTDAKRWGPQILDVTQSRYMPPWLPTPGHGDFADVRRLTDDERNLIKEWVSAGMPEGDGIAPPPPVYNSDWQLGEPDLVLEMESPLTVPASGTDLFMNFALPTNIPATKWVRAMEIQPGSPRLVHHANVILDRTASLRHAHPADWQSGVEGMDILVDSGTTFDPDSHFLFWKPDSTALVEPPTMPWRLDPGTDLVLNMHLKPTGRKETVKARIGLYFTDKPATARPILLQLERDDKLDIPAGAKAFTVEDSLKLPIAVDVLGVYPHAHYLGKRLEGWAALPNGERKDLVLIEDWDIDRQSVYRLARPLRLPAETVLHMRYVYDNSATNPRNPNSPPVRVTAGNRSADEMAHLWLQVLPVASSGDGREALESAWMQQRLSKDPNDTIALYNIASLSLSAGHPAEAIKTFTRVSEQRPDDPRALIGLGTAQDKTGDWQAAQQSFEKALSIAPNDTDAAYDLALIELRHDEEQAAEPVLRSLVQRNPKDAEAQAALGELLIAKGDLEGAIVALHEAVRLHDAPDSERLLAMAYANGGRADDAITALRAWIRLTPEDADAHAALAQVLDATGNPGTALTEQRRATELSPKNPSVWNDLGVMEARSGNVDAARRDFQRAIQLDPGNKPATANLEKLQN